MSNDYTSKYHGYLGIPGEGDGIRVFLDNETDNLIYNTTNENLTDFLDRIRNDIDNIIAPSNDHITDYDNPHRVTAKQTGAVSLTENETILGEKSFSGFVTMNELSATKISGDGSGITNISSNNIVGLNNMSDITINSISSSNNSNTTMTFENGAITLSKNTTLGSSNNPITSIYSDVIIGTASLNSSRINNSIVSESIVLNSQMTDSEIGNSNIFSSQISDVVITNATFNSDIIASNGYKFVGDGSGLYNLDAALSDNILRADKSATINGGLTLNNSSAYLSIVASNPKFTLEYPLKFKYSLDVSSEDNGSYPLNIRPFVYDNTTSSYSEESGLITTNRIFAPYDDLSYSLGETLRRWKNLYSENVTCELVNSTDLVTNNITVTGDINMSIPQSAIIGLDSSFNELSLYIDNNSEKIKNDVDNKLQETQSSIEEYVEKKMDEIPQMVLSGDTKTYIQQLVKDMILDLFHGAYDGDSNFIFEGEDV